MAKNKFYGVRVGHKVGVFNCWSDCSKSVTGYSGAEYKGAPTYEEAYEFVYGAKPEVIEASRSTFNSEEDDFESESDVVSIYTCGIQSPDSTSSAYGYVMNIGKTTLKNMSKLNGSHDATTAELSAVIHSLEFCLANDILNIELCYINEGVERWALGEWNGNTPVTRRYVEVMHKMQSVLSIGFKCIRNSTGTGASLARVMAEKGLNY